MRKSLLALSAAMLATAPAHAGGWFLDLAVNGETQRSRMNSGVEAIDSELSASSVRVFEIDGLTSKRGAIQLAAFNAGQTPGNIGTENITMATPEGVAIPIIAYDQLLREEKKRQTWAAIGAVLGAAANGVAAANAGYSHGTASVYSGGRSAFGSWNSYNGGQAYLAQAAANQQNAAVFSRMAETNAAQMEALQVNLRTTTIDPGDSFGGQVMFEMPKDMRKKKVDYPVVLAVKFGEEVHTFNAVLRYRKK